MKKSSQRWLQRQSSDPFVKSRIKKQVRSRAFFKIEELCQSLSLNLSGKTILELGAAPGGWSQFFSKMCGPKGQVVGCDLLPILPLAGATFIQGDFTDKATQAEIEKAFAGQKLDLIASDLAPNCSGIAIVDQCNMAGLLDQVCDFAPARLSKTGTLILKIFVGTEFNRLHDRVKTLFQQVKLYKPRSSRSESREMYLIGQTLKKE